MRPFEACALSDRSGRQLTTVRRPSRTLRYTRKRHDPRGGHERDVTQTHRRLGRRLVALRDEFVALGGRAAGAAGALTSTLPRPPSSRGALRRP